jgi:ABC-type transport system involved in multi-copper enzyme maturation permease subunit
LLGPIFNREWLTLPRQGRHYVSRVAYVGLLWVLGVTTWQTLVGWDKTATLGDTAQFALILFRIFSYVQLTSLIFFAALSAAATVAREKDRRTFVLLLMTDLASYEIVLGKLFGSLLQIILLLAAMVPVLAMMFLLGGIAPEQVGQATLIMLAAAVAAGSVGSLVALWREKTFPTLALTVLFLVLYLCLVRALGFLPNLLTWVGAGSSTAASFDMATLEKWLDPFEALASVLDPTGSATALIGPAYGFAAAMAAISILINIWAVLRLRVWNPSGEPIMQREQPTEEDTDKDRSRAHAAPGAPRAVWRNPILWREVATLAYGRRPYLVKIAYAVVFILLCYYAYSMMQFSSGRTNTIGVLMCLVAVSVLSLLLIGAQAVTAITSERDSGALDLLLVTDLTPKEFIFGKLSGIAFNTKEFIIPPLLLAVGIACYGLLGTPPRGHPEMWAPKNIEGGICVDLGFLVVAGFAAVLGMHVALRTINSQLAILNSLGTIFFLWVGTGICIGLILINPRFESQWFSFLFFLGMGIGGLWWVLNGERPSGALTLAAWLAPPGVFYAVTNILVGKPGSEESADPLFPFVVVCTVFGFAIAAMLVPLLSEFDVALGRTTAVQE